jgi:hypothetical protein
MELTTLENQMLMDIYCADMEPGMSFEFEDYNLTEKDPKEKNWEFSYYLAKLKKLGLIKYEENEALLKGGNYSTKYDNNVAMICEDKIHIDSKGIKLVNMLENKRKKYKLG